MTLATDRSLVVSRSPRVLDRAWQLLLSVGYRGMRMWWRARGGTHRGALIALYVDDRLLIVRSSYKAEWGFPGGGVEHGETPAEPAIRELVEEIGLSLKVSGDPTVVSGRWDGRLDTVHVFDVRLDAPPSLCLDNREIIDARLVTPAELAAMGLTGPVAAYLQTKLPT